MAQTIDKTKQQDPGEQTEQFVFLSTNRKRQNRREVYIRCQLKALRKSRF